MPLITVVLVLIGAGVLLWLANTYIPMQAAIKQILNAVIVICVVLWLFSLFFDLGSLNVIRVGRP